MPAKRSKDRLDLQNSLGGIYVGGYEQKLQDRRNEIKITKNCRDLIEKRPYLIKKKRPYPLPLVRSKDGVYRGRRKLLVSVLPGLQAAGGLVESRNGERRARGSRMCAHPR
jgi:hypothetical protein